MNIIATSSRQSWNNARDHGATRSAITAWTHQAKLRSEECLFRAGCRHQTIYLLVNTLALLRLGDSH